MEQQCEIEDRSTTGIQPYSEANVRLSQRLRVIVVCFMLLCAVGIAFALFWRRQVEHRPQVAKLEARIAHRVTENDRLVSQMGCFIANGVQRSRYAGALEFYHSHLKPAEVELLLFDRETLVFWSSNIDIHPEQSDTLVRLLRIGSCRYLAQHRLLADGMRCVLLSRFYMDYPYQNSLLRNGFCAQFDCLEGYSPSRSQSYGAVPVNVDGVEPFYLVPTDLSRLGVSPPMLWAQWLALLLLCGAGLVWLGAPMWRRRPVLRLCCTAAWIVGLRIASLSVVLFDERGSRLFSPELFASSTLNPSLGDFLLNSVMVFALVALICNFATVHVSRWRMASNRLWALVFAVPVWAMFGLIDFNFVELVHNSTLQLEVHRIFSIDVYTGVAYLAMACWISGALLLLSAWMSIFGRRIGLRTTLRVLLITFVLYVCLTLTPWLRISLLGLILAVFMAGIMLLNQHTSIAKFGWFVVMAAVVALYSTLLVRQNSRQKDDEIGRMIAIGLSAERDPLAELLLGQISTRLHDDSLIVSYLTHIDQQSAELYAYLRREYFRDYLNRYDMRATACFHEEEVVYINASVSEECSQHFIDYIEQYGSPLSNSGFYYLNLKNGAVNYIGQIKYTVGDTQMRLFVELESLPSWEQLGYPELLIEGKQPHRKLYGHSFAKYYRGKLVSQGGEFDYPLSLSVFDIPVEANALVELNGYTHTIYSDTPEIMILVGRKRDSLLNITAAAIYCFVFYLLAMFVLLRIGRWPVHMGRLNSPPSFKSRIKWAMGIIVVLSMLLVAGGTLLYSVRNFEQRTQKNLSEKLMSITLELYRDLPMLNNIEQHREALQDKLIGLSNVFYTDINIYDTTGLMAITSRPEMFERGLMGRRMDCMAWSEMHWGACAKYVGSETIGSAKFLSAYVPIIGAGNETVAYLNLPYFTKGEELSNDLYSIVIAIVNVYTLMLLLSVLVAIVISEQITSPLALIRQKMRQVSISGQNAHIAYEGNDEVGQLVSEYNRMLTELERSAMALAQSQRESAWREMARQVAHEVKNPLTPIKLSLQHLIRAKKAGVEGWDALFDRFAHSLEEQIDTLSRIASEFSTIAKLPVGQAELIEMRSLLNDVLNIFVGYADSQVSIVLCDELAPEANTTVRANRDQLMRVFNNLIINAIQAIGYEQSGKIDVLLKANSNDGLRVEVCDSGMGISPEAKAKLFTPNFTTKTGGSGLGLAISKAIVETYNGQIGAESQPNEGAMFWVNLPLA